MKLTGKTILITRAEHQAGELADLVEREGGRALLFPTIRITEPDSWTMCDSILDQLSRYTGIIFTSSNAVSAFLDHVRDRFGSLDTLQKKTVFTVGEKTAARVHAYGMKVDLQPAEFTAEGLAALLQPQHVSGKRFIFPRGNLGRDTLAQHILSQGGEIDELIVYRTEPPETRTVELVRHQLQTGQIDAITFTSPSTARYFFQALPDYPVGPVKPAIAVIGPVTASALEKLGYPADVMAQPSTIEALVEFLSSYFKSTTTPL